MLAAEYRNEVAGPLPHPRRLRLPKEYEIERLYREAAFMLIGEGTSDIQKMIIGRALPRTTSCGADPRQRTRWWRMSPV